MLLDFIHISRSRRHQCFTRQVFLSDFNNLVLITLENTWILLLEREKRIVWKLPDVFQIFGVQTFYGWFLHLLFLRRFQSLIFWSRSSLILLRALLHILESIFKVCHIIILNFYLVIRFNTVSLLWFMPFWGGFVFWYGCLEFLCETAYNVHICVKLV